MTHIKFLRDCFNFLGVNTRIETTRIIPIGRVKDCFNNCIKYSLEYPKYIPLVVWKACRSEDSYMTVHHCILADRELKTFIDITPSLTGENVSICTIDLMFYEKNKSDGQDIHSTIEYFGSKPSLLSEILIKDPIIWTFMKKDGDYNIYLVIPGKMSEETHTKLRGKYPNEEVFTREFNKTQNLGRAKARIHYVSDWK